MAAQRNGHTTVATVAMPIAVLCGSGGIPFSVALTFASFSKSCTGEKEP
jgi:hypothetical protein